MPFYEYECSNCRYYVEVMQRITDDPLKKCPSCGKSALKKLMSAPVFRLKGSGWYETDFKSDQERKRNLAGADTDAPAAAAAEAKSGTASDTKAESKTDSKAPASGEAEASKPAAAAKSTAAAKSQEPARSRGQGARSPSVRGQGPRGKAAGRAAAVSAKPAGTHATGKKRAGAPARRKAARRGRR